MQDATKHQVSNSKSFIPVFLALCLGAFQVNLDEVVLGIAAPTISDEFNALDDIGWYGSAYLLTSSSFQLVFGKLYTIVSIKTTYLAALAIFEVGSIVCATARTSTIFIIGRAVAGLGAGGILSGTLTIISRNVPLTQVAAFNGIVGAVNGVAFFSGPLISGAIVSHTTWRWIFFMNPIIAGPAIPIVFLMLRPDQPQSTSWIEKLKLLNLPSAVILASSLICLLLPLHFGGTTYSWHDARIIVLFVLFVVLLVVFILMQTKKSGQGLVPRQVLKQRSILFGMLYCFSTAGVGFAMEYYLPIYLQAVKGRSVLSSGILLLPVISGAIVFTLASGFLVPVLKYYVPFMYLASIFLIAHIGLLISLRPTTPVSNLLGYQVPGGIGLGLALQQGFLAAQTVLPRNLVPIGLSLMVLSQTLGGSVSLTACQAILTDKLRTNLAGKIPGLGPDAIASSGATNLRGSIPEKSLDKFLRLYNNAMKHMWYLPLVLACLSIFAAVGMEWKRVLPQKSTLDEDPSNDPGKEGPDCAQDAIAAAEKQSSTTRYSS